MPALKLATSHPRVASLGASRGSPMVMAHHLEHNNSTTLTLLASVPSCIQKVKAQQLEQNSKTEPAKQQFDGSWRVRLKQAKHAIPC